MFKTLSKKNINFLRYSFAYDVHECNIDIHTQMLEGTYGPFTRTKFKSVLCADRQTTALKMIFLHKMGII